jgi:hypothetical protein
MPTSQVSLPLVLGISFMFVVTGKCGEKKFEDNCPHGPPRPYGKTTVART